ncbi:hypothetical protein N9K87_04560 [Flavobacteriaceae bacterium]|jgi:hypothetical protein|nr:hypothetical protein [Flavobacteriaceae bacterium]
MKKLPDFSQTKIFTDLFRKMNTNYSETLVKVEWEKVSIERQIKLKGEAEIVSSDDFIQFLEIDGVFRINGSPVLLYIRDQGRGVENIDSYTNENYKSEYRYHLMCCRTVHNIIFRQKRDRYVYKDYLFEEEPKFKVNVLEGVRKKELNNVKLQVCQNCINETAITDLKSMNGNMKQDFLQNFTPKDFCRDNKNSYVKSIVGSSYMRKEIDMYPKNWNKISSNYKKSTRYKCENCNIDLSQYKRYLHVHHTGRKDQNEDKYLESLCIECHANVNQSHYFMRSKSHYRVFVRDIKPKLALSNF